MAAGEPFGLIGVAAHGGVLVQRIHSAGLVLTREIGVGDDFGAARMVDGKPGVAWSQGQLLGGIFTRLPGDDRLCWAFGRPDAHAFELMEIQGDLEFEAAQGGGGPGNGGEHGDHQRIPRYDEVGSGLENLYAQNLDRGIGHEDASNRAVLDAGDGAGEEGIALADGGADKPQGGDRANLKRIEEVLVGGVAVDDHILPDQSADRVVFLAEPQRPGVGLDQAALGVDVGIALIGALGVALVDIGIARHAVTADLDLGDGFAGRRRKLIAAGLVAGITQHEDELVLRLDDALLTIDR